MKQSMKIFQNWSKKNLRGDHRTKGGTIGKKIFQTCFYQFKMIVLMKENVFFNIFKAIWKHIKKFSKWSKKYLRGDHSDQRGDHWKKNFSNMFLSLENDCFDETKGFFNIFKAIWSIDQKIFKSDRKKI